MSRSGDDWYRSAVRTSRRIQKAAGEAMTAQATEVQRVTKRIMSGVVTPALGTDSRGKGRWEEGRWGLGPLALRDYRLFIPPGVSPSRPAPVLVLLHGCGQDAASMAACTRVANWARSERVAVLLPEQSSHASPQRCWSWFGSELRVATEAMILMSIIEHVCYRYPLRRDRLFALGISAGGAMALTLALRYPDRFQAVGSHSGAIPHSAANALQASQVMLGRRSPPRAEILRPRLFAGPLPPMILLHGKSDRVVTFDNALSTARLWLDLLPPQQQEYPTPTKRTIKRGQRHPYTVFDWKRTKKPYVRLVDIQGLGHAWSGGAAKQAFTDPNGPDALKLAWRFFQESTGRAAGTGRRTVRKVLKKAS